MAEKKGEKRRGKGQMGITHRFSIPEMRKPQVNKSRGEESDMKRAGDGKRVSPKSRPVCKCGRLSYPRAFFSLMPPQRSN